ncbi:SurA N-terminal domain-containing protein [Ornithinicoccus halotolerans]|uniref:SurA N-terminal domain-containing protein n=1 Tax=Ornithinicoccus halotolerans TaxID=1748220 RepID=UPI00129497C6|nr:SurA N-terminal domain-containing protein [Ornithinicoccus halotolerans]
MTPTRQHRRTAWLAALALSATAVLAACGSGDSGDTGDTDEAATSEPAGAQATEQPGGDQQAQPPEADVSDVPDVVAEVNGEEITKDQFVQTYQAQFQQAAMTAQASGEEVDQQQLKQQTADRLVDNELLVQEAESGDYDAGAKQVDQTLDELAASNGMGSADQLLTALKEQQGMSEEQVREEVRKQVLVEALIADRGNVEKPTEEELKAMYDKIAEQQGGDGGQGGSEGGLPPFKDVKPQLEQQVQAEKENEAVQALVAELRQEADITVHL